MPSINQHKQTVSHLTRWFKWRSWKIEIHLCCVCSHTNAFLEQPTNLNFKFHVFISKFNFPPGEFHSCFSPFISIFHNPLNPNISWHIQIYSNISVQSVPACPGFWPFKIHLNSSKIYRQFIYIYSIKYNRTFFHLTDLSIKPSLKVRNCLICSKILFLSLPLL